MTLVLCRLNFHSNLEHQSCIWNQLGLNLHYERRHAHSALSWQYILEAHNSMQAEINLCAFPTLSPAEQFAPTTEAILTIQLHYTSVTLQLLASVVRPSGHPACVCSFLCLQPHEKKCLWKIQCILFLVRCFSPSIYLTQGKGRKRNGTAGPLLSWECFWKIPIGIKLVHMVYWWPWNFPGK